MTTSPLKDVLSRALHDDGVEVAWLDEGVMRLDGLSETDAFSVLAQTSEQDCTVCAFAVSTLAVPAAQRAAIMELITRINFGLVIGCFELDLEDGELRFRASVDVEGATPDGATLKNVVFAAAATFARYLPAVADVIDGEAATDALNKIDG
jgi:hypothetical protein